MMAASLHAAAAAAAAAERILRPPAVLPVPGEGLRRLVHTNQHSAPARALEERYRGSQIWQKKEGLCVTSQLHRRPMTTAKKVTKWTAAALVGVAGAIAVGALATGDEAEDWPHCHRCGGYIPREYVLCGQNLPRHIAEAMQAASKCGQASGAVQNQEGTVEV